MEGELEGRGRRLCKGNVEIGDGSLALGFNIREG